MPGLGLAVAHRQAVLGDLAAEPLATDQHHLRFPRSEEPTADEAPDRSGAHHAESDAVPLSSAPRTRAAV